MGSDETATATPGGPRLIDVFDGRRGAHRVQIVYFFRMQIGRSASPSGIGLGSGSRLRRMRRFLGLPMPRIENLGDLGSGKDVWLRERRFHPTDDGQPARACGVAALAHVE